MLRLFSGFFSSDFKRIKSTLIVYICVSECVSFGELILIKSLLLILRLPFHPRADISCWSCFSGNISFLFCSCSWCLSAVSNGMAVVVVVGLLSRIMHRWNTCPAKPKANCADGRRRRRRRRRRRVGGVVLREAGSRLPPFGWTQFVRLGCYSQVFWDCWPGLAPD